MATKKHPGNPRAVRDKAGPPRPARRDAERRRLFCWHFVNGEDGVRMNGGASARAAGYAERGSKVQASHLLDEPEVIAEITRLRDELMARVGLSRELILEELRRVGFAKLTDVAEWAGETVTLKPSDTLGDEARAAVESVRLREAPDGSKQVAIKLHSKVAALQTLLAEVSPSIMERRRLAEGGAALPGGGRVVVIVEGGPMGFEIPAEPTPSTE